MIFADLYVSKFAIMASTGVSYSSSEIHRGGEKQVISDGTEKPTFNDDVEGSAASIKVPQDSTHRKLKPRHIQLIGIGGTIGTALYVNIGRGLMNGGPGSLFLAFSLWYVGNCAKETETHTTLLRKP